ncbi:MAG: DUF2807 domain-containing protein [Bacteroidota bacterium]
MKITTVFITILIVCQTLSAQSKDIQTSSFDKIIISPNINVTLVEAEESSVRIDRHSIPLEKINVEVKGKTLRLFLEDAKITTKTRKERGRNYKMDIPIYKGGEVTATIFYTNLKKISIRGEEEVVCESPIKRDRLKVKMYGEAEFIVENLEVEKLKVALFGENYFEVKDGFAKTQTLRTFGENEVNLRRLNNKLSVVRGYGENEYKISADNAIRFSSLGEASIAYSGDANFRKMIVLGETEVRRR